jgi:cyclohexanecarboxylate-CoA ligase
MTKALAMRGDVGGMLTQLSDELIRTRVANGEWPNLTITDLARAMMQSHPERVLVVEGETELTVRQIWDQAHAVASSMRTRGLREGDIVAMQMPNWAETMVIYLAASLAGVILIPVLPILRESEVRFMLRDSNCRLLFVSGSFRNFDYVSMIERLAMDLPDLETVVVLRSDPGRFVAWQDFAVQAKDPDQWPRVDPDSVKIIMYTSGTTGRPKGVMHTHNTLQAECRSYFDYWKMSDRDVIFMASAVSHITGALMAFELPWAIGAPVILQEKWDACAAVDLFLQHGVTFTTSSAPFLQELLEAARNRDEHLPSFKRFVCGGMAVSPQLIREAHEWFLSATIGRCFGLTEVPSITLAIATRDQIDLGADTDGVLTPGAELRVSDPNSGARLERGEEGEIAVKAPEQFVGYLRPEDNEQAFDSDGFFLTGDIGRLGTDNTLTITGRKKDLIIRGGENISAREIEDVLMRHPAIVDVAVVAMPHDRLGEGVACFLTLRTGHVIDQKTISQYLIAEGLARQKIPERIELIDALPRNFQGKVLKNILREQLQRCGEH